MLILDGRTQFLEVVGFVSPFPSGCQQRAILTLFDLKSFFHYPQSHLWVKLASATELLLFLWSLTLTQLENFSLEGLVIRLGPT